MNTRNLNLKRANKRYQKLQLDRFSQSDLFDVLHDFDQDDYFYWDDYDDHVRVPKIKWGDGWRVTYSEIDWNLCMCWDCRPYCIDGIHLLNCDCPDMEMLHARIRREGWESLLPQPDDHTR